MMQWVTSKAVVLCSHTLGVVGLIAQHRYVKINGGVVLTAHDPAGRPIVGCPNIGPTIKPCTATLAVQAGYSRFVSISGDAVCMDTVTGLTDGTPPGSVKYMVRMAGQSFVSVSA